METLRGFLEELSPKVEAAYRAYQIKNRTVLTKEQHKKIAGLVIKELMYLNGKSLLEGITQDALNDVVAQAIKTEINAQI